MAGLKRRIVRLSEMSLRGVEPGAVDTERPEVRWVDPLDLLVDETYQRSLAERSIKLIRKIITEWSWDRFKPPICAETPDGLEVIDGQHTAIAAATHPDIAEIPVMVTGAQNVTERADAFLGHNRDRLALTQQQIHFGAVAAKDPVALDVDKACRETGVTILKAPPYEYKVGDTFAIGAITSLVKRRGVINAARVLSILVGARCKPVSALQVKAVETLLFDPEYSRNVTVSALIEAIHMLGIDAERDARIFAATHKVPIWRGLVVVYYRKASGRRSRSESRSETSPETAYPTGEISIDEATEFLARRATVQKIKGAIYVNGDRRNLTQLAMRINRILERNNQPAITIKPVYEVRKA